MFSCEPKLSVAILLRIQAREWTRTVNLRDHLYQIHTVMATGGRLEYSTRKHVLGRLRGSRLPDVYHGRVSEAAEDGRDCRVLGRHTSGDAAPPPPALRPGVTGTPVGRTWIASSG